MTRLQEEINAKTREHPCRGVPLQHDSAPAHSSLVAHAAILECGFDQANYQTYFPGLVRGNHFPVANECKAIPNEAVEDNCLAEHELKSAILNYFEVKDKEWFWNGMAPLTQRYKKCAA